ncbi:hypothetical protein [Alkalibacillus salilacus]|uniref:Cu/Ag efflux pump CusA n=1 Tax=Alkalibacillus salilacus TaxID=284582 RepID=A0ABT9VH61_9BACI|nr:hypothetical protein [Alkalibacillus salilacus]MDQ0160297.1 Cu/Ag efflux pump CusA [Alkalibacillus salilacus]
MKYCKSCQKPIDYFKLVDLTLPPLDREKLIHCSYCRTSYRLTTASFFTWLIIIVTFLSISFFAFSIVFYHYSFYNMLAETFVFAFAMSGCLALTSPLFLRYKSGAHFNETI